MKKKHLIFCLLFLVLGTTIAWADKYYQPGSYRGNTTPRLTLAQAVESGKKFMIYNTAIDGGEDRTGFLRNNGVRFEHDKTKERDLLIYNESFVYTMEAHHDDQDGNPDWYAIKSVETGLYVNASGRTDIGSAADAKLYITDWDNATGKAGVNMENWKYNIVANGQITSSGNGSTVFVVKNGDTYWNGEVNSFATWSTGHPFAFYVVNEYTNSNDFLTDLHIYSRADIYSAQVIYGYVQDPSKVTTNFTYNDEGGTDNLLDGDATTYNVTNWTANNEGDYHYYQVDLGTSVSSLYLYMQRRADGKNAPIKYELQACATAGGQYTTIGEYETNLATAGTYSSPLIEFPDKASYQHIRIVAKERSTANYMCMGLSELYVLPGTQVIKDVLDYVAMAAKDPVYTHASERVYRELVEKYNAQCPEARLLSGVPLPGNKYRIYADAYDIAAGVYVNRELKVSGEGIAIMEQGAYHKATDADKKYFEWYCELTSDGYLVFKNEAGGTIKYLGSGVATDSPYKWSMNTVETHRFGVPLKNTSMQYLAMATETVNGEVLYYWQGDIKKVQDQTMPYYSDNGTPDDTSDDVTINGGLCTDFVFIPVPLAEGEKKITITGNDLVKRNTQLLFDANGDGTPEVHALPFSRMFRETEALPTINLLCKDIHSYEGIKVNEDTIVNTNIATLNGSEVTLNWADINDGDILNLELEIIEPFEVMPATFDTKETPKLYYIRSKQGKELAQQALPYQPFAARAADPDIEIEEDGPLSTLTSNRLYATFSNRGSQMSLVTDSEKENEIKNLTAHSLFYFTATEDKDHTEHYAVNINNATTVMKCADNVKWDTNGNTWFVQPKKTTSFTGYNIGRTALNATNDPNQAWKVGDNNEFVVTGNANADGTTWEFVPVDEAKAKELLYNFIKDVVDELQLKLDGKKDAPGLDNEIIGYYKQIAAMMLDRATYFAGENYTGTFTDTENDHLAKLLQFAQNVHMLEHEIEYALQALPLLSKDLVKEPQPAPVPDYTKTRWYYIRNVAGGTYATYSADESDMLLQAANADKKLANMFYFVGEKNSYASVVGETPKEDEFETAAYTDVPGNNLIIDEYLKVHIHNFQSMGTTLVSKNVEVPMTNFNPTPGQGVQKVANVDLKGDEDWSIELEYNLSGTNSYNAYGSALLASGGKPLEDGYTGGFQVYLKDDRSIVIKVNNNNDSYRFWHTQDYFTHIKVVITYSKNTVTLDVYNSNNEKETKVIEDVTMNNITELSSALPDEGATIKSLATYKVETMNWKTHEEVQGDANKDDWYILPSSNTEKTGLAIVLGQPNDNKMGWAKAAVSDTVSVVSTDLGTATNSTWAFERVTDFDAHVAELLSIYNFEDCVIYDPALAGLVGLIAENKASIEAEVNGPNEEALFNELYYNIINYTGAMPDELKAPKRGSLYTIRPTAEEEKALLVHIGSNGTYTTKEVYNDAYLRGDDSYDTRAVWAFEGSTAAGDFLALTGLKVKNLHTQCYLNAPGTDATVVNESGAAAVTLAPLGGLTTSFKVGDKWASSNVLRYKKNNGLSFWGTETQDYPQEVGTALAGANELTNAKVYCKRISVKVVEDSISVTFRHIDGSHKLNILGVTLVDKEGNIVAGKYHHGKAGGSLVNNEYTLKNVASGDYTLNCYFGHSTNGGNELNQAGGVIEFTGVSNIEGALTKVIDAGTSATKWIVEEIKNPETAVYHPAAVTASHMHGTLMLGFDAKIPAGVEAYRPCGYGNVGDGRYVSMEKYTGIIPAGKAVILKRTTNESTTFNFHYSATPSEETIEGERNDLLFGSLYNILINCDNLRQSNDKNHVFMLQASQGEAKLFRIWENRNSDGSKTGNNDNGGYIQNNANKAYFVLPFDYTPATETQSFSLRYDGYQGTTGIEEIEQDDATTETGIESLYDLQGRKLTEITEPGIYIVNGKKIVVK